MEIIPHNYQVLAAKHLVKNPASALFLDLGLGKTVISLTANNYLQKTNKIKGTLILAPLRVVYNVWPQEIKKWDHLKHLKYSILHGIDKEVKAKDKSNFYITNYESIKWLYNYFKQFSPNEIPFDSVVYDESAFMKNKKAKRFKLMKSMSSIFKYKSLLNGTPAPNSLLDLWAQYYLLDNGKRLGTKWSWYRAKYFQQMDYMGYDWQLIQGGSQLISDKVTDITMRLKADDYLNLPDIIYNNIYCTMPSDIKPKYKQLEKDFLIQIENETIWAANSAALSNKLRQFVSGSAYTEDRKKVVHIHKVKLDALAEILESNTDEAFLIAIQFRFEYDLIAEILPGVPVIYGGVNEQKSQKLIEDWNAQKIKRLVVHPASIGWGLNLQDGGRSLIWFSIPWSWWHYTQLIGRLRRQGQKDTVRVHHLMLKDSVDERVLSSLQRKYDTEETFLSQLRSSLLETV
jgi:SNF2 family DNA or RNA helicase